MEIKVYGSNICPGTLRFLSILTENGVMPTFINVTGSISLLKEFITFRDTSPLYDDIRGTGSIGFPLIQLEDGSYTRDVNGVLRMLGIETEMKFH
ncbi:MAG: glutaredoxin [Clostridiales bacterium]|nr:glutaredoxin [Clostridiales bacterium]